MVFEETEPEVAANPNNQRKLDETVGIEEIIKERERLAAAQVETEKDPEANKEVPLRDRVFTNEEVKELEKKTWIEIKDLIFETEPNILDYLSHHCKRWR